MGGNQSSVQLQPVREPAALLNTGAGLIVRIPDSATGESTYEYNLRATTAPISIVDAAGIGYEGPQAHVAVVRPGEGNQALKGSIVYLKKTRRSSAHDA